MIKPSLKEVIRTVSVFVISYIAFLFIWLQIKDPYGFLITTVASKAVTAVKDVRYEYLTEKEGIVEATFSPLRHGEDILIDIPVKTSSYTFNAPLTMAIMAGLYPYLRRRLQGYSEALLILFIIHLLYVFSLEANELTGVFVTRGLEKFNKLKLLAYQFLWGFTDNMLMRFEPFLYLCEIREGEIRVSPGQNFSSC